VSNAVACLLVLGMALLGSSGQAQVWEKKALSLDAARKMVRAIEAEAERNHWRPRRCCPPRLKSSGPWLTSANILDSESKISPFSSPLGTSRARESRRIVGACLCLVVGWTDPEGARPRLGALLLAYYDPQGKLVYAGRVGAGISQAELERLWRRLQPLATSEMPLDAPPPRSNRFGSPLVLSRVHWVRLED